MIHAGTPWNENSTRAVFRTEVSYGNSGKLSGAKFKVNCLEKWRISSNDMLVWIELMVYEKIKGSSSLTI